MGLAGRCFLKAMTVQIMNTRNKPAAHFSIVKVQSAQEVNEARTLFEAYQKELGKDLSFQQFDAELRDLPNGYTPPSGALLLLLDLDDNEFVGCVGVKKLQEHTCEMKRLYVKPSHRVKKYGLELVQAILQEARQLGYQEMCLDTLEELVPAIRLYQKLGFQKTEPYYDNPYDGVVYMRKVLS